MSENPTSTDDVENRRRQLRVWIDLNFDGVQAKFVDAIDINQGELSGLLKSKSFGEKKARSLELKAGMPPKFLEQRGVSRYVLPEGVPAETVRENLPVYLSPSEWPFKRVTREQFNTLTREQRAHIEETILMLLPIRAKIEQRKSGQGR